MADKTYESLLQILTAAGQQHVLRFWHQLVDSQREQLERQIRGLDLTLVNRLWKDRESGAELGNLTGRVASPPGFLLNDDGSEFTSQEARESGEQALRCGAIGVVIVAGGQGTRLGFPHPKGMFPIGPVSGATLFQILFEKVKAVIDRYCVRVPVYVMTSPATHEETVDYLTAHDRFGLEEGDVTIFCQGTMPAVDTNTGKLLLSEPDSLSLSPDGHGGMLRALRQNGLFDELRQRAVEQLFYLQIDNPLVPLADPEFIGYHRLSSSEATSMVVRKTDPTEKVGIAATVDGRLRIIEYSDVPAELTEKRDTDGELTLWAGNIAAHLFDVSFLERAATGHIDMPFHVAHKKVPYLDEAGQRVEPDETNAIKFERFIFDLLPAAGRARVVEVDRHTAFAPVKNAAGSANDSPDTVRRQMQAVYRQWLQAADIQVADHLAIEVSPLFALDAQELSERVSEGMSIETDTYLRTPESDPCVDQLTAAAAKK